MKYALFNTKLDFIYPKWVFFQNPISISPVLFCMANSSFLALLCFFSDKAWPTYTDKLPTRIWGDHCIAAHPLSQWRLRRHHSQGRGVVIVKFAKGTREVRLVDLVTGRSNRALSGLVKLCTVSRSLAQLGRPLRPLHTKRQRQLMAMFPSILGSCNINAECAQTYYFYPWTTLATVRWTNVTLTLTSGVNGPLWNCSQFMPLHRDHLKPGLFRSPTGQYRTWSWRK